MKVPMPKNRLVTMALASVVLAGAAAAALASPGLFVDEAPPGAPADAANFEPAVYAPPPREHEDDDEHDDEGDEERGEHERGERDD